MEKTNVHRPGTKGNGTLDGTGFWGAATDFVQVAGGLMCSIMVISFFTGLVRDSFADRRREACRKQCRAERAAAQKRKKRKKG